MIYGDEWKNKINFLEILISANFLKANTHEICPNLVFCLNLIEFAYFCMGIFLPYHLYDIWR